MNKSLGKRIFKWIIIGLVCVFLTLGIIIGIFNTHSIRNIKVDNGNISNYKSKIESKEPRRFTSVKAKEIGVESIDISVYYKEKKISDKVYEKALRYYVDFERFAKEIGASLNKKGNVYVLNYKGNETLIDTKALSYNKDNENIKLRGEILYIDSRNYIGLNDIEYILNMRDKWDIDKKSIHIFDERKNIHRPKKEASGKAAMIRVEDVSSGGALSSSVSKEKMKIMVDKLYENGMKFHVAWVPRFVNPAKKIDNGLLINNTMENAQFINMMDYFIQRGGVVGLHGYTHQSGKEVSLQGFELTRKLNPSEEETRKVIENGISEAKTLNIPLAFFESPHYGATGKQQKIIEEYFNVLYEPYSYYFNLNPIIGFREEGKLYVPAPMSYVKKKHGENVVNNINRFSDYMLTSLFIHGSMEMPFIDLKPIDKDGYVDYEYIKDSPLANIIKTLKDTGHTTITVNDLKK